MAENLMEKLHITKGKEAGGKSSSSSDEDVDKVVAILSNAFDSDFYCTMGTECAYDDPKCIPEG